MLISSKLSQLLVLLALSAQSMVVIAQTTMDLLPFSLEIESSNAVSENTDVEREIMQRTIQHLGSFIASQVGSEWDNDEALSMKSEKISLGNEDSLVYHASLSFTGTIQFPAGTEAPTSDELEDLQWDAFIGEPKMDYLTIVRNESLNEFLIGALNVKISWTPQSRRNNLLSILWACAIGVIIGFTILAGYFYYNHIRKNKTPSRTSDNDGRQTEKLRSTEVPDLELAATGSMSPTNDRADSSSNFNCADSVSNVGPRTVSSRDTIDVNNSVDMLAWKHNNTNETVPFEADMSRISKTAAKSIASKDTVDVQGNVDMLAWKHTGGNMPFETDMSRISKGSPNKTLEVDFGGQGTRKNKNKPRPKGRKKTDQNYLSKDMLSQHNESRFKNHARRYSEKMQMKRNGGMRS